MSTSLYYKPHIDPELGEALSFELKKAIAPRYYDHDGSLGGGWYVLDEGEIPFLEGLLAAGIEDAKVLIDAIRQYETIEIALIG